MFCLKREISMVSRASTLLCAWVALSAATNTPYYPAMASALDANIEQQYAYLDKLPGGTLPQSATLNMQRKAVNDEDSLLRYAENRIISLADHHAITCSSFKDSWAVVPTYADLWVVSRNGQYIIDAVREGSPAALADIQPGNVLLAVDRVKTASAIQDFWLDLGLAVSQSRADFAARVLAAGRRDRPRQLSISDGTGKVRHLTLPSLYSIPSEQPPPVTTSASKARTVIRFNNSLGDDATITAFDEAMQRIPHKHEIVLDLRDTPSGGNTTVARAVMGWFTNKPHGYQVHNRPVEERETGIARQWIEQVLPRSGKHRQRLPTIWVGRWTGSMGEGLAIGFASMRADIRGGPMAELNGSVEDLKIGDTDMCVTLPTERLMTITYTPREQFLPRPMR
jgi:C-terminal processing protease CtpA/Prc